MAVRAIGSSTVFRSASSSASYPTLLSFRCRPCHFTTLQFRRFSKLGIRFPIFRSGKLAPGNGGVQRTSVHSLVNSVMEELGVLRRRRLVRAAAKVELTSSGGIVDDKFVSRTLQQGLLLEFKKDAERVLLAVAQKPDGKKNWMVSDLVLLETQNN